MPDNLKMLMICITSFKNIIDRSCISRPPLGYLNNAIFWRTKFQNKFDAQIRLIKVIILLSNFFSPLPVSQPSNCLLSRQAEMMKN